MRSLEALYERLQRRTLDEELRTGLWMIIGNIRERNYAAAADVYLRLAIGNAPWPIGVTQVSMVALVLVVDVFVIFCCEVTTWLSVYTRLGNAIELAETLHTCRAQWVLL